MSSSFLWQRGRHQARHLAGLDHSLNLETAPHGEEQIRRFAVVGRLGK